MSKPVFKSKDETGLLRYAEHILKNIKKLSLFLSGKRLGI